MSEEKESIKIFFDMNTGLMTYEGPIEDGEELLKMVEKAGGTLLLKRAKAVEK